MSADRLIVNTAKPLNVITHIFLIQKSPDNNNRLFYLPLCIKWKLWNMTSSVSNVDYRVPGYPGNLPLFWLFDYPGNWVEYRVFTIKSKIEHFFLLFKHFCPFLTHIFISNLIIDLKKINLHLVVSTLEAVFGLKGPHAEDRQTRFRSMGHPNCLRKLKSEISSKFKFISELLFWRVTHRHY
jgi:hypothetical protein